MTEKLKRKPPYMPTDKARKMVELHATMGTPQDVIADLLGIDDKTLRKYFRAELDNSLAVNNAKVGGVLFNKAMKGDTTAAIFWLKTRARWRETQEIDHKSTDGSMTPKPAIDASQLSNSAMAEILAAADAKKK